MKHYYPAALFVSVFLLSGCATGSYQLKLDAPETYSLERGGDGVWRVNHHSAYYEYFNKVHRTYHLLMRNVKDPDELRRLTIERDLKIARKRLEYMADPGLVRTVIRSTSLWRGINPTGHLFRMNDVESVPRQSFTPADPSTYVYRELKPLLGTMSSDAMTAIIQFDRQLKKRGVTLLVVPVPNAVQLHAHKLHQGIRLEDNIWHPWSHMIAKLLEYDVEVIDLLDLYKAYNGDNTTINYIDHHWGQAGLDIVSLEVAERLKRFRFDDKYYLDPAAVKRVPITVDTPAMIPYWDRIDVGSIAAGMPYSPKYQTVRITYRDRIIQPARTFEDSPVLIMGDSFIFHAAETSSGIYAHLAYHTGIIPAQFSRNAAAAEPPSWYRANVAGKGREPKVVIWEIYGSAFEEVNNQNDWKVVTMPDPPKTTADPTGPTAAKVEPAAAQKEITLTPDRKIEWIAGEVIKVSDIPNVKSIDYPDALYAFHVRVTDKLSSRLEKGKTIVVYRQFMEKYKLLKDTILKKGDQRWFYLEKWTEASQATEKIGTMQLIDDLEDYDSDIYFTHFQQPRSDRDLAQLKKTYLEKGAMDKDGKPLEALTFKLDAIRLIESVRVRLHHEKAKPALFAVETSIDGVTWFTLYQCRSTGGEGEVRMITLDSVHPALYIRLSGAAVKKEIGFDGTKNNTDDFSGIEIFGY